MEVPAWAWLIVSGLFGGLTLAYVVDGLLAALRRWVRGRPAVASHFSPKGGCEGAVVAELTAARQEVLVQAYSFTSRPIADALIAAAARGVRVVVLLDRSNVAETHTELGDLTAHKVEVWIDAVHAIAHNKVMVIDRRTVITGSFNFTNQAEHENAENLLILRHHHDLAALYRANVLAHQGHCHKPAEEPKPAVALHAAHAPHGPHAAKVHRTV